MLTKCPFINVIIGAAIVIVKSKGLSHTMAEARNLTSSHLYVGHLMSLHLTGLEVMVCQAA
jgi:hypothetical protein